MSTPAIPSWSEIESTEQFQTLDPAGRIEVLNKWTNDAAANQAAPDLQTWAAFERGYQSKLAEFEGREPDPEDAFQTRLQETLSKPPENVAILDDAKFDAYVNTLPDARSKLAARASRDTWSQIQKFSGLQKLSEAANPLSESLSRRMKGGVKQSVSDSMRDRSFAQSADDLEIRVKLNPINNQPHVYLGNREFVENADPNKFTFRKGEGVDVTDWGRQILAAGGTEETMRDLLKDWSKATVWGNVKDQGNLVRSLRDGTVVVNPQAGVELFNRERVKQEALKEGLSKEQLTQFEEQAEQQRAAAAATLKTALLSTSGKDISGIRNLADVGGVTTINVAEAIGLKSDFKAFAEANDDKFETDADLIQAYADQLGERNSLQKTLDGLITGAYAGSQSFQAGVGELAAAPFALARIDPAQKALEKLSAFQSDLQTATGFSTGGVGTGTLTTTRAIADIVTMIGTGGASTALLGTKIGARVLSGQAKRNAVRQLSEVGMNRALINAATGTTAAQTVGSELARSTLFRRLVVNQTDKLAQTLGNRIGWGTGVAQSAAGTISDSYLTNLNAFLQEGVPREEAEDLASNAAAVDGVVAGTLTATLMKLIPGGVESVFGKNVLGGRATLNSLRKDLGDAGVRALFKSPAARQDMLRVAGVLGSEAGKEAVEEGLDEGLQSFYSALRYSPDMTWNEWASQTGTAALLGGFLGGGVNAIQSATTQGVSGLQAQQAQEFADIAGEAATETVATEDDTLPADTVAAPLPSDLPSAPDTEVNDEVEEEVSQLTRDIEENIDETPLAERQVPTDSLPEGQTPAPVEGAGVTPTPATPQIETVAPQIQAKKQRVQRVREMAQAAAVDLPILAESVAALADRADAVIDEEAQAEITTPSIQPEVEGDTIETAPQLESSSPVTIVRGDVADFGVPIQEDGSFIRYEGVNAIVRVGNTEVAVPARDVLFNGLPIPLNPQPDETTETTPSQRSDAAPAQPAQETGDQGTAVEARLETPRSGSPDGDAQPVAAEVEVVAAPETVATPAPAETRTAAEEPVPTTPTSAFTRQGSQEILDEALESGVVPTPAQIKSRIGGSNKENGKLSRAIVSAMVERYPINTTYPQGTSMVKMNSWLDKKSKIEVPVLTSGSQTRGVFTNDPIMTAAQMAFGAEVVVPAGVENINPAIRFNSQTRIVQAVDHPRLGEVTADDTTDALLERFSETPEARAARERSRISPERAQAREQTKLEKFNQAVEALGVTLTDPVQEQARQKLEANMLDALRRQSSGSLEETVLQDTTLSPAEATRVVDNVVVEHVAGLNNLLESLKENPDLAQTIAQGAGITDISNLLSKRVVDAGRKAHNDILAGEAPRSVSEIAADEADAEVEEGVLQGMEEDAELATEKDLFEERAAQVQLTENELRDAGRITKAFEQDDSAFMNRLKDRYDSTQESLEALVQLFGEVSAVLDAGTPLTKGQAMVLSFFTKNNIDANMVASLRSVLTKGREAGLGSRTVDAAPQQEPLPHLVQAQKQLGLVDGDPQSILVALDRITADNNFATHYRNLARNLRRVLGETELPNFRVQGYRAAGEYNRATNTISLSDSTENPRGLADTLLHELVHFVEAEAIANPDNTNPTHVRLVNNYRAIRDAMVANVESIEGALRAEALKWAQVLGYAPDSSFVAALTNEFQTDVLYALGLERDGDQIVQRRFPASLGLNPELQEISTHYHTDPVFRYFAERIRPSAPNVDPAAPRTTSLGKRIRAAIVDFAAGLRSVTSLDSPRGREILKAIELGFNEMLGNRPLNNPNQRPENDIYEEDTTEAGIPKGLGPIIEASERLLSSLEKKTFASLIGVREWSDDVAKRFAEMFNDWVASGRKFREGFSRLFQKIWSSFKALNVGAVISVASVFGITSEVNISSDSVTSSAVLPTTAPVFADVTSIDFDSVAPPQDQVLDIRRETRSVDSGILETPPPSTIGTMQRDTEAGVAPAMVLGLPTTAPVFADVASIDFDSVPMPEDQVLKLERGASYVYGEIDTPVPSSLDSMGREAPAGKAPKLDAEPVKKPDFKDVEPSVKVARMATWVVASSDNGQLPFVIADKQAGTTTFFDKEGRVIRHTPALFGKTIGDFTSDEILAKSTFTVTESEKVTPAGRFETFNRMSSSGNGLVTVYREGQKSDLAFHKVYLGKPSENRPRRLSTPTGDDNRVSHGCINLSEEDAKDLLPLLDNGSVTYVLPETEQGIKTFEGFESLFTRNVGTLTLEQQGDALIEQFTKPSIVDQIFDDTFGVVAVSEETDQAYLAAVEAGDMQTAQRMVDEAAENAGYWEKLMHGTRGNWTAWDTGRAGGLINLTDRRDIAESYAQGSGGYRDFSNPNIITPTQTWVPDDSTKTYNDGAGNSMSFDEMRNFVEENIDEIEFRYPSGRVVEVFVKLNQILDLTTPEGIEVLAGLKFKTIGGQGVVETARQGYFNWQSTKQEAAQKHWRDDIIPQLKQRGFDAVVFKDDRNITTAVFDPDQIKSADPVTRDESGNIIPLSKRFNTESDNILYSRKVADWWQSDETKLATFRRKQVTKNAGGYVPDGPIGFGVRSKELADIQLTKNAAEAAAESAATRFLRHMNRFFDRELAKESRGKKVTRDQKRAKFREIQSLVGRALGSTTPRLKDAQRKTIKDTFDGDVAAAKIEYRAAIADRNTPVEQLDAARTQLEGRLRQAVKRRQAIEAAYTKENIDEQREVQLQAQQDVLSRDETFYNYLMKFRKDLDTISAEVANATGISPDLKAAIVAGSGLYLHRAYRIIEDPRYMKALLAELDSENPNRKRPYKDVLDQAYEAVRKEQVEARAKQLRREAREQMIRDLEVSEGITNAQARLRLRFATSPLSNEKAVQQATDYFNTKEGQTELTATLKDTIRYFDEQGRLSKSPTSASNTITVKPDILKRRREQKPWLRALWGEYDSPQATAFATMMELERYRSQERFLNSVVQIGTMRGKEWLTKDKTKGIPNVDTTDWVKITEDPRSPLFGYYAPEVVRNVLDGMFQPQGAGNIFATGFLKLTGFAMASQTVLSVQSHVRNFVGNPLFLMANGNLFNTRFPADFAETVKLVISDLTKTGSIERENLLDELQRLRIIKDATVTGILNDVLTNLTETQLNDVENLPITIMEKITDLSKRALKAPFKLYQSEDDFWKIMAFFSERRRIRSWNDPSLQTDEEVNREAARRVRETMPTYSMAYELVSGFKKNGIVGAFITFVAESIRVTIGSVRLAIQDIGSSNPRRAASGSWRLISMIGTMYLTSEFGSWAIMAILRAAAWMGGEDEERPEWMKNLQSFVKNPMSPEQNAAYRDKFTASWDKDSVLLAFTDGKGKAAHLNLSYINPYNYWTDIMSAATRALNDPANRERTLREAATNIAAATVGPLVGEQIFFSAAMKPFFDNSYGTSKEWWNDGDFMKLVSSLQGEKVSGMGLGGRLASSIIMNAFMPGTVKTAQKLSNAAEERTRFDSSASNLWFELAALTGFGRLTSTEIDKATVNKLQNLNNTLNNDALAEIKRSLTQPSIREEDLRRNIRSGLEKQRRVMRNMAEVVKAAEQFGTNMQDVADTVDSEGSRLTNELLQQLNTGTFETYQLSPQTITNTQRAQRNSKGTDASVDRLKIWTEERNAVGETFRLTDD